MLANWDKEENDIGISISKLTKAVTVWNRKVFGNVLPGKRRLEARIGGIQKAICSYPREELIWFQKSRVCWLKNGDRNTRLFHTSTLIRRRN